MAGASVTFTATVTGFIVPPSGNVRFRDNGVTIATIALNGAGEASFTTSTLATGSHPITVVYDGDILYNPSTSSTLTQVVNANPTTTSVLSSVNPSALTQSVSFTATVTSSGGTPAGTVTFMDGATVLGSASLNGSGETTFTTGALVPGAHSISAVYGGDTNYLGSTSSTLTQNVNLGVSSTTLISSSNPAAFGQSVTFTATVNGVALTPTGTVTFMDGATTLGSGTVNGSGQATLTTAALALGSHSITAVYGGNTLYASSTSSVLTQIVNQATTTTAVSTSQTPSSQGSSVTFTATVTSAGGIPSGNVTFMDGASTIGTGTLSGGSATFTTAALALGSHSITAVYDGSVEFFSSTSPNLTQDVVANSSSTALVSNINPSSFGQAVTFTATVTGTGGPPTGNVTFRDGATVLGTGALDGAGVATYTTSNLAAGNHSITARYTGSASFAMSLSPTVVQAVGQNATATSVVSSANPSPYGSAVTFTATVNGTGGTPSGTVTFMDGATVLGSAALNGSGQAALSIATLVAGNHPLTAVYGGDSNFTGGTSPIMVQAIGQNAVTVALASSANPSPGGQPIQFTATVTAAGGTPTGNVTFHDGSTVLGTVALTSGQAVFAISTLSIGMHSITASYGGDNNFAAATSAALNQSVSIPPDSLKLRAMQLAVTRVSAQVSGQAISGAIDSAVSEGLSDSCRAIAPNGAGLRISSCQSDSANLRVRNGFAALRNSARTKWVAWGDVRGIEWNSNSNKGDINGRQVNSLAGITHRLTPNLIVGLFGGFESFNYMSDSLNAHMHGDGWTGGGYLGWQLMDGLRFDVGAARSAITYAGAGGTASGSFSGARTFVQAGLAGTVSIAKNWELQPSTRAFAVWEKDKAYVDSLGTSQEHREFMTGRASAGAKLTYRWQMNRSMALSPYVGLYADYNFAKDTDSAVVSSPTVSGKSARVQLGLSLESSGGAQFSIEGEAGGLGSDEFTSMSVRSRAVVTF